MGAFLGAAPRRSPIGARLPFARVADAADIRYAKAADGTHLAFQVIGDGKPDILLIDTWVHHVELVWDIPERARFMRRLADLGRLIHYDRRGTGLSDTVAISDLPDLETQVADALTVLDAVGSEEAVVVGAAEGGPIAILLATSRPDRCAALVLAATAARMTSASDYPWGPPVEVMLEVVRRQAETWGRDDPQQFDMLVPSRADDVRFVASMNRIGRSAVRPGAYAHYFTQSVGTDVRDLLASVHVPSLCVAVAGDRLVPTAAVRHLAREIAGAKYAEVAGEDHVFFIGSGDLVIEEIEEFLTGARARPDPDRILATVLFTDIVGSTGRVAALGDRRWRELLDSHDAAVRSELSRFGGNEVDTAGDGFFATFDGPGKAIRCAHAITSTLQPLGLAIRAGVHTGECEVRGTSYSGMAVHIGARVAALAGPDEVYVSSTVKDLLAGSGLDFEDRGERELKGVPGTWRVYAASGGVDT
jgi:class 3 adenylate cyclase/pimeloyl-ACP methyl ester carboxylesterase